jgi:mannitol/fructose-specific phosphotransferase system IIA component (Ntr-type)
MIGASDKQDKDYIRLLSRLVLRLKNPEFINSLMNAENASEMYKVIVAQK